MRRDQRQRNIPEGILSNQTTDSKIPHLYEIVKNDLKVKIINSVYPAGKRIPSERELIEEYGCSRITIRRAVDELVDEGYLVKRHGTGTFAANRKHSRHVINIHSFTADCLMNGITPRTEVTFFGFMRPSERDRVKAGAREGVPLLHLHRVRYANGEPVIIERIVFPEKYNSLSTVDKSQFSSVTEVVQSVLGVSVAYYDLTIEQAYATKQEAEYLKINPGDPLLMVSGGVLNENRELIYYSRQIIVGDRYTIAIFQPVRPDLVKPQTP